MVMKKIKYLLIVLLAIVPFINVDAKSKTTKTTATAAAKEPINFYIFYGSTCGYCAALHEYVAKLEADDSINYMFNVVDYEVWGNENNSELMSTVAESFGEQATGIPYYVIGDKSFTGFSEESSAESIKSAIKNAYNDSKYKDVVAGLAANSAAKADSGSNSVATNGKDLSEEKSNSTTGYIILAITVVAIVLVIIGRNKSSNELYEDVEEVEVIETKAEAAPVKKVAVKTTKSTKKNK